MSPRKLLLLFTGFLALLLGIIGIVVPGLPTTPFVLLAGYCFAQASPRLHQRLLANPWFGDMIRNWERERALPLRTKRLATAIMILSILASLYALAGRPWLQTTLALLGLVGCVVVWRIPTLDRR
ncbi:MAG: hypothetical protein RIR00_2488 [Pseudomonadota bacterium]|jgi:uncharacterized membrane protein YbaN (DUF454 family)